MYDSILFPKINISRQHSTIINPPTTAKNMYKCPHCPLAPSIALTNGSIQLTCPKGHFVTITPSNSREYRQAINVLTSENPCKNCGSEAELYCEGCGNYYCGSHRQNRLCKKHVLVNAKKYYKYCPRHLAPYDAYCKDHGRNLCRKCDEHRFCSLKLPFINIVPSEKDVEQVKIKIEDFKRELKGVIDLVEIINSVIESYRERVMNYTYVKNLAEIVRNYEQFQADQVRNLRAFNEGKIKVRCIADKRSASEIYEKVNYNESRKQRIEITVRNDNCYEQIYFLNDKYYEICDASMTIDNRKHSYCVCAKFSASGVHKIVYTFSCNLSSCENMFSNCRHITEIKFVNVNTELVTSMAMMFANCVNLIFVDLKCFKTRNVYDMSNMFLNCSSLLNLNLISFNTDKVVNMSGMFGYCENLEWVDISTFNFMKVKNVRGIFERCEKLETIRIRKGIYEYLCTLVDANLLEIVYY